MIREKKNSCFKLGVSALLCLFTAGMVKAEINKDPFPAFSALKESVKIPRNAKLTVSEDGNFLIDGKPRYLPGAIYYEDVPRTLKRHTTGYPVELNWLYEDVLDYEGYQRVGLDATGIFATSDWIKKYRDNSARGGDTINDPLVKKIVTSCIPLYLDFTCAPWHHGFIKYEKGKLPAKAAFNVCGVDNNHWMPYSATTPEGRELYFEMWRRGAESSLQIGAKPFVYELFNEPNYNDWSEFNRNLFAERMREKYKSIKKLNAEWKTSYKNFKEMSSFKSNYEDTPLFIEWTKFMEDCFADICRAGIAEIKKVDKRPDVLFCVQPLGTVMCNVNFYKTNQYMNAVGAPTGGGNALMAKLLKALAKGKPIFDGETYMGNTRASIRNQFWLQYSRGFNASFVFKWDRRPYDQYWPKADEAGGKLVAERFPYLMLNPYALPTTELLGIMDAKTEILKVNDFFTPRDRGVKPEIAFLFSTASKRLARAQGSIKHNQNEDYALALEYAPLAFDVVFEEQLQQDILKNYKIAIIAGVETGNKEMADALEKFVRNGGMLIVGQEAMQNNEYGFKRADDSFPGIFPGKTLQQNMTMLKLGNFKTMAAPYSDVSFDKTWSVTAKLGDEPAILTKKLGKGEIFYLNTKMHLRALSSLFEELVKEKHIAPSCAMRNYLNDERISYVEVNKAVLEKEVGYILFNNSSGIQLVRFRPTEKNMTFADPLEGKQMQAQNGEYFICLLPNSPRIIIGGSEDTLKKRFSLLPVESFKDAAKAGKAVVRAEALKNKKSGKAFNIEPNLIKTINLRANVNSGFNGGWNWIKKPETGIQNAPYWGIVNCNGVPFGFVRGDHNEERTCIVTGSDGVSNVKGIEVNSPVKNFFFLHSALQNDNNIN
ncbi:MAG: beta-galactosidase trimerization domain-containing protein, partial [Victivallales bacterium]|nr:beta-galactosidase trimerization domain-containing protein [Victivallales bacterium]